MRLIVIYIFFIKCVCCDTETNYENLGNICLAQTNCRECVRAHSSCTWCFDKGFSGQKCNTLENLDRCQEKYIEKNNVTKFEITKNEDFTADYKEAGSIQNIIQFQPQQFNIKLRKGEPINITIKYQPAKNFPLELYYLMDLTNSMKQDLQTMKDLGGALTQTLSELTKVHKIAFGSYVDKVVMPFYLMDPINLNDPCFVLMDPSNSCERGYLFKHKLNFTEYIDNFTNEVQNSGVSANVDNLEGGLDALMQIILCKEEIGWSQDSRKVILLVTESMMHLAGDGLLSGSTKRNRDKCLIDKNGQYLDSVLYDYPSLEEIHRQLQMRKISLIFASKQSSLEYYREMEQLMSDVSFVGELKEDSGNVLNLIKDGYYDFMRIVSLKVANQQTLSDYLDIQFFADCDGNKVWNKTDTCNNAEEGKAIQFNVQFTLKKYPNILSDVLYIEEKNINENITVAIDYSGCECGCSSYFPDTVCVHGRPYCGDCICTDGWTGIYCNDTCNDTLDSCRYNDGDTISRTCFGNGDCTCGKCSCWFPFGGEYCNYTCPFEKNSKLICGGHGQCITDFCKCSQGYTGDDCTCSLSTENCNIPGATSICNGHGSCECNQCKCDQGYSGQLCEICSKCEGFCNLYKICVENHIFNETESCTIENDEIVIKKTDKLQNVQQTCYYRYENEGSICEVLYTYKLGKNRRVDIEVEGAVCSQTVAAGFINIGLPVLAAIILAGILAIIFYKVVSSYRDKIEYQRFIKEQQSSHREMNPLYKDPVVQYNNPMRSHID